MFPLIPYRFRLGTKTLLVPITLDDLLKAYNAAPDLVEEIQHNEGRFWRSQGLNLMLSGCVPLAGYLLFDWPMSVLMFALVLGYATTWLCDFIRSARVPYIVDEEIARAADTELAAEVAAALNAPEHALRSDPASSQPPAAGACDFQY